MLTEQVFTIPGFGKLIVDAVFNRDYAVVQGVVLVTATAYITLNLLADLAYFLVNPRLRSLSHDCRPAAAARRRARASRPVAPRLAPPAPPPRRDGRPRRSCWASCCWRSSRPGSRRTTRSPPSWSAIRKAPSATHWFGTDEIGRDVLSRVIWGARASLLAGVVSVSISLLLGVPIGLAGGLSSAAGSTALISRITDALLACPFLILAIALAAFLGPSLSNAMIAIGISATPIFVRLTRAQVLAVKVEDYVEAARAVGNPPLAHRAAARAAQHDARR